MQDRIKEVRKHYKLTQTEFGERIGVKGNTVSGYETGLRTPSDAVIVTICREINCNEIWLRTGDGDPFQEESRQEQIMRFATQTVNGSDEFKKAFVSMLAKMDADDWENLAKLFRKLSGEIKKE